LRIRTLAVALLLAAGAAAAQPLSIGDRFPLTNTRYRAARGRAPLLVANGTGAVVFWTDGRYVRSTHVGALASRVVLDVGSAPAELFDAVWTGRQYLVVIGGVLGRLVAANGDPLGPPFAIAAGGGPRLAWNGRNALLLYSDSSSHQLASLLLNADGTRAAAPRQLTGLTYQTSRPALASNGDTFAAVIPHSNDPHLLLFDALGNLTADTVLGDFGAAGAIASDGRRYLAVLACAQEWTCAPAYARLVEVDGRVGPPTPLDEPFSWQPSAVWSGSEWIVSYIRGVEEPGTLNVLHMDADAAGIQRRETQTVAESSLAVVGGHVIAASVGPHFYDTVTLSPLPLGGGGETELSLAATWQIVSDAASSANGVLVAWQEQGNHANTLNTGFRAADGSWSERALVSIAPRGCFFCYEETLNVLAASDGHEFVVLTSGYEHVLRRFDAAGAPIGNPIPLPGDVYPQRILWSGHDYLLISHPTVTRLSTAGAVTATLTLPPSVGQSSTYASDGNGGLLAAWIDVTISEFGYFPNGVFALRLDDNLRPVDAAPIALDTTGVQLRTLAAGWDGERYVVAWSGASGIKAARIAANGAPSPAVASVSSQQADDIDIAPAGGGTAIRWHVPSASQSLAFFRRDGTSTASATISTSRFAGLLATLPDGDVAYLEASIPDGAPFESRAHVMTTIASAAPLPAKPAAPLLAAQANGLAWSAASQPVSGWRLELRRGDGPWVEVNPTFMPSVRSLLYPTPPEPTAFRIRAWNDAGTSEYSNIVVIGAGRHRAAAP
jgi:hypothetical protein